jgi:hypothetical protein
LRSKWAAGKAVRAGLALGGRIQPHFFAPEDRQNKREMKKVGLDVTDEQRSRRPIFIATLRAAAKDMLFRGQDTNKTTSPGMRSRRAAQPARRKLWLHELNGRRETRTRERIRYSQSLSGVPQRWLWSARDSGKAGKQKRKWNYGSIGMLYHSMFPDGNACHETPTISCSSVRRLAICSTCASTRSAALKVTLITVRASSVPTSLSIL